VWRIYTIFQRSNGIIGAYRYTHTITVEISVHKYKLYEFDRKLYIFLQVWKRVCKFCIIYPEPNTYPIQAAIEKLSFWGFYKHYVKEGSLRPYNKYNLNFLLILSTLLCICRSGASWGKYVWLCTKWWCHIFEDISKDMINFITYLW
jgi:hypothetical protein